MGASRKEKKNWFDVCDMYNYNKETREEFLKNYPALANEGNYQDTVNNSDTKMFAVAMADLMMAAYRVNLCDNQIAEVDRRMEIIRRKYGDGAKDLVFKHYCEHIPVSVLAKNIGKSEITVKRKLAAYVEGAFE